MSKTTDRRFMRKLASTPEHQLSPRAKELHERGERRELFIRDRVRAAERDEANLTERPDLIYSGLQRGDVFTADPTLDNNTAEYARAYQRRQALPIKEMSVSPEGDFEITLSPEATEAVRLGFWCHTCHEPQPDNDIEWGAAARRLEGILGPKPAWAAHGVMCCYCGAKLGISGDHKANSLIYNMTPDQRKLLEEMFGSISV